MQVKIFLGTSNTSAEDARQNCISKIGDFVEREAQQGRIWKLHDIDYWQGGRGLGNMPLVRKLAPKYSYEIKYSNDE